jgi:replicative DNA helicase
MSDIPTSPESESVVLGSILAYPDKAFDLLEDKIDSSCFFNPGNKVLWEALLRLRAQKRSIDMIQLTGALQELRKLDEVGGAAHIAGLLSNYGIYFHNLASYVEILIDQRGRRGILKSVKKLENAISTTHEEIGLAANEVKTSIKEWEEGTQESNEITRSGWLEAVEDLEIKSERRRQIGLESALGISTPWQTMNRLDYGIQEETFTIIAACTSQGKTKLLLQMLAKAAHQGVKSLFFSMEESKTQVIQELLCQEQAMTTGALDGYVKEADFPRIGHVAGNLRDLIFIDDSPNLTVEQIRSRAKRFKLKHPDCKIIAVDHHMLIRHSQRRNVNEESLLAEISIGLSSLKKELGVAVFLLCQINREGPKTGRPRMRHIKGSGQFEQDADKLWIIQMEDDNTGSVKKGKLYKDKGRFSPIGEFPVTFSKNHLLFTEGN